MSKSPIFSPMFFLLGLVLLAAPAPDPAQDTLNAASTAPTPAPLSSLSKLPAEQRYTPPDKTFKVWMPAEYKEMSVTSPPNGQKKAKTTQYKWEMSEGIFAVTQTIFERRDFDDDKDLSDFLSGMNQTMLTQLQETKLISTKSVSQGKWRGTQFHYQSGQSVMILMRILALRNISYTLTMFYLRGNPDAEKQLFKAMDSFEIIAIEPSFDILPVSDGFISKEYNFSIGMPKNPTSSNEEKPAPTSVPYSGWKYDWAFYEGNVSVSQSTFPPESAKKVLYLDNYCSKTKDGILKQPLFKLLSETSIKAGEVPGCELVVSVGGGQATGIFRYYVTKTQMFGILATIYKPDSNKEKVLRKALDTFIILKR